MRLIILLLMVLPSLLAARIQLIDITPEEAQQFITQQSLDLRYAKLLSSGQLGAGVRGHGGMLPYFNGEEIENPNDYIEEIYDANQFHGQDGLGRAVFGYTDHNQARLEARNTNGEVRGQYQYVDPFGQDVHVQYWSDAVGFHQTDNRPKFDLQPVSETPEVKQAREAHERAWAEAARLAAIDPDPMSDVYNAASNKYDQSQFEDPEQELDGQVSNQHQSLVRYPTLPYDKHIIPENDVGSSDSIVIEASASSPKEARSGRIAKSNDKEEEYGPPRGFFYKFDYETPIILEASGRNLKGAASVQAPSVVEKDETADEEPPSRLRISEVVKEGLVPTDSIHDQQTSPKQRKNLRKVN